MTTSLCLAAWLVCAQISTTESAAPANPPGEASKPTEKASLSRFAASTIDTVTVYRGQALISRDVAVPAGNGTVEVVVSPISQVVVEASLYTEGSEGLRVLSTRSRTRTVADDSRKRIQLKSDQLQKLENEGERIQKAIALQGHDLQYLQKLEGFTGVNLNSLTEKGRLDSREIIALSRFVMENRESKTKAEVDLNQEAQANAEALAAARSELNKLSSGSSKIVREAVIVVQKTKAEAGNVRLTYLVNSADWQPRYRLRGATEPAPVRLEYLAAVSQETGEDWSGARLVFSTSKPTLDASPPEFLPLKVVNATDSDAKNTNPVGSDPRSAKVAAELVKVVNVPFATGTPLEDVVKYLRSLTQGPNFPEGIPVYIDPVGLADADVTITSPVIFNVSQVSLNTALKAILKQLGLAYSINDGLLTISSDASVDEFAENSLMRARGGAGMGGFSLEQVQTQGGANLNRVAADDQTQELRVSEGQTSEAAVTERDIPIVTFNVEGRLDIQSGASPQLIEVARIDLPAEYFAKAVPVLTPRVYRLAKLANTSALVLLPGEATVYVGTDFVGKMRLPLVAAGEPFIAGFGVDPQIQVSRRLMEKSRTVQGGNQIFNYEFRIGMRNYRSKPVKVQLWDRLPKPEGEAVGVSLTKTSTPISTDPLYLRTARIDNLLQWDIDLKEGTVADKTFYLNYEFRIEYARDLPTPRFDSGGLREAPIGGGAMGGMGGGGMGGGGFR